MGTLRRKVSQIWVHWVSQIWVRPVPNLGTPGRWENLYVRTALHVEIRAQLGRAYVVANGPLGIENEAPPSASLAQSAPRMGALGEDGAVLCDGLGGPAPHPAWMPRCIAPDPQGGCEAAAARPQKCRAARRDRRTERAGEGPGKGVPARSAQPKQRPS